MRKIIPLNKEWTFIKVNEKYTVDLPHTWNARDTVQDNSNYYQGECIYEKKFRAPSCDVLYIEILAANSIAEVYINNNFVGEHLGGYSAFRFNITKYVVPGENLIQIKVNNQFRQDVYPIISDFNIYGGLYRGVQLIALEESHFDMDRAGSDSLYIISTPNKNSDFADVTLRSYITNPKPSQRLQYNLYDREKNLVATATVPAQDHIRFKLNLYHPHLWDGVKNPYLYTAEANLIEDDIVIDQLYSTFGIREFSISPKDGFFLNRKNIHLRGLSKHQDRYNYGNAVTKEMESEDINLLLSTGANSIRLAHYQHSQNIYDLCDQNGLIVWTEIPFVIRMSKDPRAYENAKSQLRELILQNFNHPSICFWGIANDIKYADSLEKLESMLIELNHLSHHLDPTRLTTIAQHSSLPIDSSINFITDVVAYNHSFGWNNGKCSNLSKWLEYFHKEKPSSAIAISKYGADGSTRYQNQQPEIKDCSESYQMKFHQEYLDIIENHPFIWASFAWNGFNYGDASNPVDNINGISHQGLISFDREIKKDSYYIYKAYWSNEPFIHIAGAKYTHRSGEAIDITVITNTNEAQLYINDQPYGIKEGEKVMTFSDIPFYDDLNITVRSKDISTSTIFFKTSVEHPSYVRPKNI